jgi:glutamate synthase (NADPH/NADH) small chain
MLKYHKEFFIFLTVAFMGKITGFLEFDRVLPAVRPPQERIKDFKEFTLRYSDEQLNQQSGRCMDCGIPFCHNGCPLGNIIPDFNDAVHRQKWEKAYQILSSTNNFPEFTGRICPAPCESACVLGINQPAVAIEEIEKHIIEIAFEKGFVKPRQPLLRTGKKIAIVGSGPAGLAAAAQLNYAGHKVTVFERDDMPGGLLRYGIPDFKLEKWVVDRRIHLMEQEGIQFKCHANVGVNISPKMLLYSYDAVVLACGSTVPRSLNIPGKELSGVHFAMHFLKQQNKRVSGKSPFADLKIESNICPIEISATGKNVVVIGGGDTGSDCIGTAIRQGAASVLQIELLPPPPKQRNSNMPWPHHPMLLKTTSSHEEGADRAWAVLTKAFLGDEKGRLRALQVVDIEWQAGEQGKPGNFVEIPETEREIPCQLALMAMGFMHTQHQGLVEQLELELDAKGNVKAEEGFYRTGLEKVFVAGDMRRGQSLVVWAISEGRECARKVDEYLMGSSQLEQKDNDAVFVSGLV